jgi:hypothetical protein
VWPDDGRESGAAKDGFFLAKDGCDAAMMQIPMSEGSMFCVIEPGNLDRLRQGHPMKIDLITGQSVLLAFTPDMQAFRTMLGPLPWTPEQIDAALKVCQTLKEKHA